MVFIYLIFIVYNLIAGLIQMIASAMGINGSHYLKEMWEEVVGSTKA